MQQEIAMDTEYSIILTIETSLVLFLWPMLIKTFSRWKNKSLRKDNPNLNRCYYLRMWGAPLFFIAGSFVFLYSTTTMSEHELIDKICISGIIFFATMFTGVLITEFLVDHYKSHHTRTR